MDKEMCSTNRVDLQAEAEQALWAAILNAEGIQYEWINAADGAAPEISVEERPDACVAYPWNPTDPAAEDFLATETVSLFEDWQPAELAGRADAFFAQLEPLWSTASLQTKLAQRFVGVPQTFLAAIARYAQQVATESKTLADQLVQCVQQVVPSVATDDLYVMARPLAFSMRNGSGQVVESIRQSCAQEDWQQLSSLSQARLGLAIARYALDELNQVPPTA
jgi:hypothetical protein